MPELTGKRILIVEDQPDVREVLSRFSRLLGCVVTSAEDGQVAWDLVRLAAAPPFDLVVTDSRMPRLSGRSLVERLRERFPTIPILRITGDFGVFDEPPIPGIRLLNKPFSLDAFTEALEESLA